MFNKIYNTLILQVKFFADSVFNVIVDHVSLKDDYKIWVDSLNNHEILFCGIAAEPKILDQRERQRCDRVIGGSRAPRKKFTMFINMIFL